MIIMLTPEDEEILERICFDYEVDKDTIKNIYTDIMQRNFEADIVDMIYENAEELGLTNITLDEYL